MSIQQLFKIENGVPEWFNVLLWSLFLLVIIFIRYFWKKWGIYWFENKVNKIQEEKTKDKKLLKAIQENEITQDHWSLEQIVDKCHRKGYRNNEDRKDFMEIYDHYKDIGGNTDGEVLLKDFTDIPYKTELKVPEPIGFGNPSEKAMREMLAFFNYIKAGIIHEEDIKPIKTMTEYVNKKDKEEE